MSNLEKITEENEKFIAKYASIDHRDLSWIRATYGLHQPFVNNAKDKSKMLTNSFLETLTQVIVVPTDKNSIAGQEAYTYYDFNDRPITFEYAKKAWLTEGCIKTLERLAHHVATKKDRSTKVDEITQKTTNSKIVHSYIVTKIISFKDLAK